MSLRDQLPFVDSNQRHLWIADHFVAHALLRDATKHKYLLPVAIKTPSDFTSRRSIAYLVMIKNEFAIGPYLAARLYPHLVNLPIQLPSTVTSAKITELWQMKQRLVQLGLDELQPPFWLDRYHYIALNHVTVPPLIRDVERHVIERPTSLPIERFMASDDYDQYHAIIHYIGSLLHQGIDINKIKLAGASSSDVAILSRLSKTNGWTLHSRQSQPLLTYAQGLELQSLCQVRPFHEVVSAWSQRPIVSDVDVQLMTQLNLIAAQLTPREATPELVHYLLETLSIRPVPVKNAVEVIHLNQLDIYDDELYTILIHASDENYPQYGKDNDYLSDVEKQQLGWSTSVDANKASALSFAHILQTTPHLVLFSAAVSGGHRLHPYNLSAIQRPIVDLTPLIRHSSYYYSPLSLATQYAKDAYAHEHYGAPLTNANERFKHVAPLLAPYQPQFKGLSLATANRLIGQKLRLSATSLETFKSCQFRYLLNNHLKLTYDENRLSLEIGTMSHALLEQGFKHHDAELPYRPSRTDLSPRELYLSHLFAAQLRIIYQYLVERQAKSQFKDADFEKYIEFEYPHDPRFHINGKIDRIQTYQEDGTTYVVVLDYKTGNDIFSEEGFHQGLDLQLVFYLHLLKHDPEWPTFEVAGFYYQPLNLKRIKRPDKDTDPIPGLLKLEGITLRNVPLYHAFTGGEKSIRGVSVSIKTNDFVSRTEKRVKSGDIINDWMAELSHQIDESIQAIQVGDYRINPQAVAFKTGVSPSCEYCPFARICYLANSVKTVVEEDDDSTLDEEETDNG